MSDRGDILVVGGYGVVGRRVSAHLARQFRDRVVIAGRDNGRAEEACNQVGNGTRPRRIDVDEPASIRLALDGIGTVVTCVAQRELHLLRASIACGLAYTDIAPRLAFWQGAEEMAAEARRTGARIVLGAGLSPGISNMMARQLAKMAGRVARVETAILLSLGDEYGPDSMHHVLEAVSQPFTILEEGQRRDAALLVRAGARRWLRRQSFLGGNLMAIDRLKRTYAGHDHFALVVTVEGGGHTPRMSIAGRRQAAITAAGAAEIARALAAGEVEEAGVWLPEQVISHEPFFDAIAALGWRPCVEEVASIHGRGRPASPRRAESGEAHP